MQKAYLKYAPWETLGLISSHQGNVVALPSENGVLAPALHHLLLWDLRRQVVVGKCEGKFSWGDVTVVKKSERGSDKSGVIVAAGHASGCVNIWWIHNRSLKVTLHGHKTAVTALAFNSNDSYIASGGADTEIVVWDVIGESGLFRLKGHRDQITDLKFFGDNRLVSSSKDTLVKCWDVQTQHCYQTLVGHRSEVWSLDVNAAATRLVTASGDSELRWWDLTNPQQVQLLGPIPRTASSSADRPMLVRLGLINGINVIACQSAGKTIEFWRVNSAEETARRIKRRFQRRREEANKRKKQKKSQQKKTTNAAAAAGGGGGGGDGNDDDDDGANHADDDNGENADADDDEGKEPVALQASDEVVPLDVMRIKHKIRSFDWMGASAVVLGLSSNAVEVFERKVVAAGSKGKSNNTATNNNLALTAEYTKTQALERMGHRGGIRAIALSSHDDLLVSVAADSVIIWNINSLQCIRNFAATAEGVCVAFLPGDRHVVVGTKAGTMAVYDITTSSLIESVDAHTGGTVLSISVNSNGMGLVTGGSDKEIKFWEFALVSEDGDGLKKRLSLANTQSHTVDDDVLCVRQARGGKLLCVALLDSTVKVYFRDSMKLFLSLYGHKLPVLAMDISTDGTLLVTGSADKNIKIWGLDFGDCHRSLFAHPASVIQVAFVPNTHYLFTGGKDGSIKYWDIDKFEHVMSLEGHSSEVWGLCVSASGRLVVSASQDRSIRLWKQTDEQLFLVEEKEKRLDEMFEEGIEASVNVQDNDESNNNNNNNSNNNNGSGGAIVAGKQSLETLKAGEKVMEALDVADEEAARVAAARAEMIASAQLARAAAAGLAAANRKKKKDIGEAVGSKRRNKNAADDGNDDANDGEIDIDENKIPPNPLLEGMGISDYVLRAVKQTRHTDVENALLVLPFVYVVKLLEFLHRWISERKEIELCCRCLLFLLKTHHNQITAQTTLLPLLSASGEQVHAQLQGLHSCIGVNMTALSLLKRDLQETMNVAFYDAEDRIKERLRQSTAKTTKKKIKVQ